MAGQGYARGNESIQIAETIVTDSGVATAQWTVEAPDTGSVVTRSDQLQIVALA